jgi:serine/threonine protein kinase
MELLPMNLDEVIYKQAKLSVWECKEIFRQICIALAYVHDLGITHRYFQRICFLLD